MFVSIFWCCSNSFSGYGELGGVPDVHVTSICIVSWLAFVDYACFVMIKFTELNKYRLLLSFENIHHIFHVIRDEMNIRTPTKDP